MVHGVSRIADFVRRRVKGCSEGVEAGEERQERGANPEGSVSLSAKGQNKQEPQTGLRIFLWAECFHCLRSAHAVCRQNETYGMGRTQTQAKHERGLSRMALILVNDTTSYLTRPEEFEQVGLLDLRCCDGTVMLSVIVYLSR